MLDSTCQVTAFVQVQLPARPCGRGCGTDGVLGAPVGRLHFVAAKEVNSAPFASQVVQQPPVGCIDRPPRDELIGHRTEPLGLAGDLGGVQLAQPLTFGREPYDTTPPSTTR